MHAVEHAVIAAAGLGSRLGLGLPKCLLEVADQQPLIHHVLDLLSDVPDIRVVVGYMEEKVISTVLAARPNTIFVRNPDFRSNTTRDSYAMGAAHLTGSTLFMDGDILFEPASFAAFLAACKHHHSLIGITRTKTDDAVCVTTSKNSSSEELLITGFDRESHTEYEWANLAFLPSDIFAGSSGWVYSRLSEFLPLPAKEINAWEVDTEADLQRARAEFALQHS